MGGCHCPVAPLCFHLKIPKEDSFEQEKIVAHLSLCFVSLRQHWVCLRNPESLLKLPFFDEKPSMCGRTEPQIDEEENGGFASWHTKKSAASCFSHLDTEFLDEMGIGLPQDFTV